MRAVAALWLLAVTVVAGCMHGTFHATPCSPPGEAAFGTIRVQLPTEVGEAGRRTGTAGKCVALSQGGEDALATARIGADGNATLPLPVQGEVWIRWVEPWPQDRACANEASAFVAVPGPDHVVLEPGGICY